MADVELRFLGGAEVRLGGMVTPVRTRKSLGIVAYLALEGATSREALAELLWPELGSPGARHNLRQELYRLGKTPLGAQVVVDAGRVSPGEGWWVDVTAFLDAARREAWAEAQALYGGPLLAGVELEDADSFMEWVQAQRERIQERWQAVMTARAAELEAGGNLRGALEAHLALLDADELQERQQRDVIRLHGLLGEREKAAERYARFAALLQRELGLEPLPETQQVAEAARLGPQRSPAPVLPEVAPAEPQAWRPPLIGRAGAWVELEAASGQLALLLGEPGMGKSRLALAFAASFGTPVVLRAQEVAQDTPLYPVAEALRAAWADPRARARLEALDAAWRAEVGRLLPELGEPGTPLGEGRARFLEALGLALLAAAGPHGALLFEDIHWADGSTLELLGHLTRKAGGLPQGPRLLATCRADEVSMQAANAVLVGLRRDQLVRTMRVEALTEDEVRDLVRALSGGEGATLFARRLHGATGGNPLFVLETLRFLFEQGELQADESGWSSAYDQDTADYSELPIPPEVRDTVLRRLAGMSASARRLLDAASLAEGTFALDDLAPAVALSDWEALEELEHLTRASVLEARPAGFAFTHDLLRRAVAGDLTPERRRLLHRRLAGTLEARGGAPARIAEHLEGAEQWPQAAAWRVRAAEQAADVFAYQEALHHYGAALKAGPADADAFAWRLRRADLLWRLDHRPAREAELQALEELAARLGSGKHQAEVLVRRAVLLDNSGKYAESVQASEAGLQLPDLPNELRAWLHYTHAVSLRLLNRLDESEAALNAALALEGVSAFRQAAIYDALAYCALSRGQNEEARQANDQGRALLKGSGVTRQSTIAHNTAARIAAVSGQMPRAIEHLHRALDCARQLGDIHLQKAFLTNLVHLTTDVGQLGAALDALQEGLDLVQGSGDRRGEGGFEQSLGRVQLLRGKLGAALRAYERAIAIADELGQRDQQVARRLQLARIHGSLGDLDNMQALLDDLRACFGDQEPQQQAIERGKLGWLRGQAQAALDDLSALHESGQVKLAADQETLQLLLARIHLSLEQPGAALAHLPAQPTTPAAQMQTLTVQLHAFTALHRDTQEAVQAAQALLDSGHLAPLETLTLRQAVQHATRHPDASLTELVHTLHQTLPPEQQVAFLALWTPSGVHA